MPVTSERPRVSLTVNAGLGDIRYFGPVIRHVVRTLDYPFFERVVTYDCSMPQGRMHVAGAPDALRTLMRQLVDDGVIDRAEEVPRGPDQPALQRQLNTRYFADPDVPARAHGGTPIYQYLHALDSVTGDYIVHLDADILFYGARAGAWIDESIDFLEHRSDAVMACPPAGPPMTKSLSEALSKRPLRIMCRMNAGTDQPAYRCATIWRTPKNFGACCRWCESASTNSSNRACRTL